MGEEKRITLPGTPANRAGAGLISIIAAVAFLTAPPIVVFVWVSVIRALWGS
jgi:hypothetical protein